MLLQHSQLAALDYFKPGDDSYGVDDETADNEGHVIVPRLTFQLQPLVLQQLQQTVDPLGHSNNYGIDLYEETLHFIDVHHSS